LAEARREYQAIFAIGGKLLGSFRSTMVAAQARLKKLQVAAIAVGRAVKTMFLGVAGLAGLGGFLAIAETLKSLFAGATDQAIEALHRERELTTALMKNNIIRKQGIEFAQRQNAMIFKQADALGQVGVVSEDMFKNMAVTLAEAGVPTKQIIDSLAPMGDILAQMKGVKATEEDSIALANAMGRAINTGQMRPMRAFIKDLSAADQKQFKALKTRQQMLDFLIKRMQFAAGANVREGKTSEGTVKMLQNRMQQLREEIGMKMLPMQKKMAELWLKALPKLEPVILTGLDKLSEVMDWFITNGPAIISVFRTLTGFSWKILTTEFNLLSAAWQGIKGLPQTLADMWNWLMQFPAISGVFQPLIDAFNDLWDTLASVDWGAVFEGLKQAAEIVFAPLLLQIKLCKVAWDAFVKAFPSAPSVIKGVLLDIGRAVTSALLLPLRAVTAELKLINWAFGFLPKKLQPLGGMPAGAGGGGGGAAGDAGEAAARAAANIPSTQYSGTRMQQAAQIQAEQIRAGTAAPDLPPDTTHAYGGIVRGLTRSWLGERGPEAVIPLSGGRRAESLLNYASRALGMGGVGGATHLSFAPNIVIHGNATESEQRAMDTRLRDLARDFIDQFSRAQNHERRLSYESGYG
jgi:predicted RNA binding protein with dsRBD fold (UPF0201 family)